MTADKTQGKDWEKVIQAADDANDEDSGEIGGDAGVLEHPSYKALEDKLTLAEQKAHEEWDKAMRAVAELENVRRRTSRDVENAHKFSTEKLLKELLPVIDSLEQALSLDSDPKQEDEQSMRSGIELTLKLLLDALGKSGLQQINPEGETFDPSFHEAISMQPSDQVAPGCVITVFQKGYVLHERSIRPARVIVAQGETPSIDESV